LEEVPDAKTLVRPGQTVGPDGLRELIPSVVSTTMSVASVGANVLGVDFA